ncbi:MAG: hypothetical protein ACLTCP_11745 [Ruminococcus bicirculans (ex Wegman et al. 2014)]
MDELDSMEPHYVDENSEFVQTLLRVYEKVKGERKMYRRGRNNLRSQHKGGVAFGAEFLRKQQYARS